MSSEAPSYPEMNPAAKAAADAAARMMGDLGEIAFGQRKPEEPQIDPMEERVKRLGLTARSVLETAKQTHPDAEWLKIATIQTLVPLIGVVETIRSQLEAQGVTEKARQDRQILGELHKIVNRENPEPVATRSYHILWGIMGENVKGNIPF